MKQPRNISAPPTGRLAPIASIDKPSPTTDRKDRAAHHPRSKPMAADGREQSCLPSVVVLVAPAVRIGRQEATVSVLREHVH
jgi:hypothetical protein